MNAPEGAMNASQDEDGLVDASHNPRVDDAADERADPEALSDAVGDASSSPARLSSDDLARILVSKLSVVPHHAITLRRNKYRVIRRIAKYLGWDIVRDKHASIAWLDKWDTSDLTNLRYFKVGHFQAMREVSSKCALARTLNRMRVDFPTDYDYFPVSFTLPNEKDRLSAYATAYAAAVAKARAAGVAEQRPARGRTAAGAHIAPPSSGCWPAAGVQPQPSAQGGDRLAFIVKPDASSRGNGIYMSLTLDGIREFGDAAPDAEEHARPAAGTTGRGRAASGSGSDDSDEEAAAVQRLTLVQAYLPRPILMDGRKFDLRIYVLVTSSYPTLRAYIYRQGLVRFATVPYEAPSEANIAARKMFLTNYAVNKPAGAPGGVEDDVVDDESVASDVEPADGVEDIPGGARRAAGRDPGMPSRAVQHTLVRGREGCKWSLDALLECLQSQGVDTDALWARIKDIITKTLLAIRPHLAQRYRTARPFLRKEPPPPAPPPPKRRPAPRTVKSMSAMPNVNAAATDGAPALQPARPAESGYDPVSAVAAPMGATRALDNQDALTAAVVGLSGVPHLLPMMPGNKRSHSATTPRDRVANGMEPTATAGALRESGARNPTGRSSLSAVGAAVMQPVGAMSGIGLGLVGTSVSLSAARPAAKLDVAVSKLASSRPPKPAAPISLSISAETATPGASGFMASSMSLAQRPAAPVRAPSPRFLGQAAGASPGEQPKESDAAPRRPKPKKAAETPPTEEEDGEQGFRCYELMGLDVILDMSHCTCARSSEFQHFSSTPDRGAADCSNRCQPRPVLLEINQSCSLHSDSDLDKVLKGDVVCDALCMAAPDETWLLERFKEVIEMKTTVATPTTRAAASAPTQYDAEADAERLSASGLNRLSDRASFDGMPHMHAQHAAALEWAAAEAGRLMAACEGVQLPAKSAPPKRTSVTLPERSEDTPGTASSPASDEGEAYPIPNLTLVPWVPAPEHLLQGLVGARGEELWFGARTQECPPGAAPRKSTSGETSKPVSVYALGSVPPLSNRAQLVLVLRRIYEALHRGGFQPLLPPPSPEHAARYRNIAEHVPLAMRETTAFARRRQEALALRAALDGKLYSSRF